MKNQKIVQSGLVRTGTLLIVLSGTVAMSFVTAVYGSTKATPDAPVTSPHSRVTLIGDSLTVWMDKQAPLDKVADVQEVGLTGRVTAFGGFTTWNLEKIVRNVPQPPTDFVLIQAGTNDVMQHSQNANGLRLLLETAKHTWPRAKIIVAPIPPSMTLKTDKWNADAAKVARDLHLECAPQIKLEPSDYVHDGIHLNAEGSRKIAERWATAIKRA